MLPLTVAFSVLALLAGAITLFLLWLNTRLAFAVGADLGLEVYHASLPALPSAFGPK